MQLKTLILVLTLFIQDKTHIGVIKAVKTINKIEIPSIPSLNFINPLIQFFSSTNWNPEKVLSKENHKKRHNIKFAKLVKIEIYFELLSFSVLKIKIKKAPNKGKKITDDKIGKSIILKLNKLLKQTVLLT